MCPASGAASGPDRSPPQRHRGGVAGSSGGLPARNRSVSSVSFSLLDPGLFNAANPGARFVLSGYAKGDNGGPGAEKKQGQTRDGGESMRRRARKARKF